MKQPARSPLLLTGLAALGMLATACSPELPEPPSNLVVICMDTVRYDSFIEHAGDDALTPWLDEAQQFADASSSAPWTMPAVASLLTGLHPIEHGAGRFEAPVANLDEQIPSALSEEAITLGERLEAAYFRTGAFVAHPFFKSDLGLRQGFQQVHNRRGWAKNLDRMWQWADRVSAPNRFFAYLHFMEAHHRHTEGTEALRQRVVGMDPDERLSLAAVHPDNCSDSASRRCLQSMVYEQAVRELRAAVAAVLQGLQDRGLLDDTLVLLYSDHGEEFWDHEAVQIERGNDPRPHTGLGHGQSLYQELLHIPLVAWHPGLAGATWDEPVSLVDVVPSIMRWLAIESGGDTPVSGRLLPPLEHGWFSTPEARTVFASGIAYGTEQVAARVGPEKAIFHVVSDEFELYDLASDPDERHRLDSFGALYALGSLTGDYLELPARLAARESRLDSESIEDLKAIGYLQGVESRDEALRPESGGTEDDEPTDNDGQHP